MFESVQNLATQHGLSVLGGFHPEPQKTLLMLGYGGREMWTHFKSAPEYKDGRPNPLDRWSARTITAMAHQLGATPHFPFGDNPMPVLTWAQQSEPLWASPIGMSVHSERGLWSSWRGALEFDSYIALPNTPKPEPPCLSCDDQPCKTACPVGAFTNTGYDTVACRAYLQTEAGQGCLTQGCLARRTCPIGQNYAHTPAQAEFHMRAFLKGQ